MILKKYELAPVRSFIRIQEVVEMVKENEEFVLVIGETGFGKSVGFNYSQEQKDSNLKLFTIKSGQSPKSFFSDMLKSLNGLQIKGPNGFTTIDTLIELIVFELKSLKKNPIVVIDEAGNFGKGSQKFIRRLWDEYGKHSGLIISGPPKYLNKLKMWKTDDTSDISELVSRINRVIHLPQPSTKDIKLICDKNMIEDKEVIDYIINHSQHYRHVKNHVIDFKNGRLNLTTKENGL